MNIEVKIDTDVKLKWSQKNHWYWHIHCTETYHLSLCAFTGMNALTHLLNLLALCVSCRFLDSKLPVVSYGSNGPTPWVSEQRSSFRSRPSMWHRPNRVTFLFSMDQEPFQYPYKMQSKFRASRLEEYQFSCQGFTTWSNRNEIIIEMQF